MKLVLAFSLFLASFCTLAAATDRPSVLVISFTSFNRSFLKSYGGEKSSMPFFDALAKESILFKNAFNQSSWRNITGSMMKIGDVRFLKKHKIEPIGFKVTKFSDIAWEKVKNQKIQEADFKFKFHRYEDHGEIKAMLKKMFKGAINKRFFSHIHYKTNHIPYIHATKWAKVPKEIETYIKSTKDFEKRIPFLLSLLDEELIYPLLKWELKKFKNITGFREITKKTYLSIHDSKNIDLWKNSKHYEKDLQILKDYYAKTLKVTDDLVKEFLVDVLNFKKHKNLMLVLMGAHGEAFMESGRLSHGGGVSDVETRIPLIIHYPNKIKEPVIIQKQFNDEAVAKITKSFIAKASFPKKLLNAINNMGDKFEFMISTNCQGDLMGMRWDNKYKLVHKVLEDEYSIYDLINDPNELKPLPASSKPEVFMRLRGVLMENLLELSKRKKFRAIEEGSYCPIRL